jgi:hypothetical protein
VTVGELGQLPVVVGRQVVADLAELLLDDMEVVDQPFRRRRDRSFVADGLGQRPIGLEQDPPVLGHPFRDGVTRLRLAGDPLGGREGFAVLLQPLDAEKLGDDGFAVVSLTAHWTGGGDGPLP